MRAKSTPDETVAAAGAPAAARRRYDSPVRRQRASETRERIVAAGAEIVHGLQSWDWRELTFRAVASQAGVSESTVFRHFANERELHDAVMERLQQQAGVSYTGVHLDEVADVADRVFASLSSFAASPWAVKVAGPTLTHADESRQQALREAVTSATPGWSVEQQEAAAGMLDVLWSPLGYERLVRQWRMDSDQAAAAVRWVIELVVRSVREGTPPTSPGPPASAGR